MSRVLIFACATALGVLPALAGDRCSVPMSQWQPKEVLEAKLKADGWENARIRIDDGCYKVQASNKAGYRIKNKFNPQTLQPLPEDED